MRQAIVHETAWPGFPGEADAQHRAAIGVYDQEHDGTFESRPNWSEITELCQQAEQEVPQIYDYEVEMLKPVEDGSRQGLLRRARAAVGRAGEILRDTSVSALVTAQTAAERVGTYYGDEEHGTRRRVIGAAAGALVAGSLAYLEFKGVSNSSGQKLERARAQVDAAIPVAKPHHHQQVREAIRLHAGENPWSETEEQLRTHGVQHPTDARIAADDRRLLKLNHISPRKALKLHVGDTLKLLKRW